MDTPAPGRPSGDRPKRKDRYIASARKATRLTPEMADLLRRRTEPFLDSLGMERPLLHLLQEAYLQGLKDAMEVLRPAPLPEGG